MNWIYNMNKVELMAFLLTKNKAYIDYPFDTVTPVAKVGKKMFALVGEEEGLRVSLKCDPEDALYLRDAHSAIIPGYHLNKKHWNTIIIDGTLDDAFIQDLIDHSYKMVVKSMTVKEREALL